MQYTVNRSVDIALAGINGNRRGVDAGRTTPS